MKELNKEEKENFQRGYQVGQAQALDRQNEAERLKALLNELPKEGLMRHYREGYLVGYGDALLAESRQSTERMKLFVELREKNKSREVFRGR